MATHSSMEDKNARKLGRHHFAFYRGWLQGLSLEVVADQYLEDGLDLRLVKSTLLWIQNSLSQAALRNGRQGHARLLRTSLRHIVNTPAEAPTVPTLEQWCEDENLDDFYSEAQLIELYVKAFPQIVDVKAERRRRLIERQLSALAWIEELVVADPVPDDWVSAWFNQKLADKFFMARIYSLADLRKRIDERGYRWWGTVKGLGETGAARIVRWLQSYEKTLGVVPAHALVPQRKLSTALVVKKAERRFGLVPLEVLRIPDHLSGQDGANRDIGHRVIKADNDADAIELWIKARTGSEHSARAYRKEAERLLLWAIHERGKALSSLTVEDCTVYRSWLSMLGRTDPTEWPFKRPQEAWIGPPNRARSHAEWRPFHGPLSVASVKQSLVILRSLFHWLVSVRYCIANPWDAVSIKVQHVDRSVRKSELTRVLSHHQWEYIVKHSVKSEKGASVARTVFILVFAYSTGMRISELVNARTEHLYSMPLRGKLGRRWMLTVYGKGDKERAVPMGPEVMEALSAYLAERGLPSDPMQCEADTPLIAHVATKRPLTTSGLHFVITNLFESAAKALGEEGHTDDAATLRLASTHWIRHSRGNHLSLDNYPVSLIQQLLGHASLATTSIYTKSSAETLYTGLFETKSEIS